MKKKGFLAMLLACSMAFGTVSMTACNILGSNDDGEDQKQEQPQTVEVTGVSLDETMLNLKIGNQKRLTATVAPATATNKSVTWSSDKPDIADVDQNGNITAKAKGTAVITVTTASGNKTASCIVNVTENEPQPVRVQSVGISKSSAALKVNENVKLAATITPADADNKNVQWTTSNANVATVSDDGLVTAKAVGKATITVTSEDGGHTAKCEITVSAAEIPPTTVNVTGVTLNITSKTLKPAETVTLVETVSPATATNKSVTWDSGNKAVATVDANGVVTAVAAGQATITVKTADGNFTAMCKITVEQPATDPVVNPKITYDYAGNECAAFEWGDSDAAGADVEYKLSSASTYTKLSGDDKKYLIRQANATTARVDIVGLQGGAVYDFKITTSANEVLTAEDVTIHSYDRSGYAHFGKSDGVGAYKDNGTPKSNATILYLTEENKNNIDGKGNSIAKYLSNSSGNSTPIIIRVVGTVGSATWNEKTYPGYNKDNPLTAADFVANTPASENPKTPLTLTKDTKTDYTQQQLIDGGFNTLNTRPAAYNGAECLPINGLNSKIMCRQDSKTKVWNYDSIWNDCSVSKVSNVTIEGIGEDAEIFQWGFTFKNSSSVEVRNIHFDDYTEDGCSFEADESDATSLSGFKSGNIWLHHNTFDEGINYWDVCDEQDKGDGDGSTDFKGLKNITIAYNHYIKTHKTGLIGGSDSVATANVTFHHNYYEGCNQRMPLGRQANMHMYNNYYEASTLYSISLRAGAYAFIENCYFTEDASNHYPVELVKGSYGTPTAKIINCSIDENKVKEHNAVGDENLYIGTDRSKKMNNAGTSSVTMQRFAPDFDTNSSLFYYKDGVSDVSVMFTAEETKTYIPDLAGVQKRDGDVTLGGSGSGSGSGNTGGGTETPDPDPTPDPEGDVSFKVDDAIKSGKLALNSSKAKIEADIGNGVKVLVNTGTIVERAVEIDGVSFTSCINTGGASKSSNHRHIEVTVDSACTITVYVGNSNGTESRRIGVYSDLGTYATVAAGSTEASIAASSDVKVTFTLSAGGTYYIGCPDNALNIYAVVISY